MGNTLQPWNIDIWSCKFKFMLKCDQLTIPKEKKMPQNMTAEEVFYLKQMAQKKPINIRNRNAKSSLRHTQNSIWDGWFLTSSVKRNCKDLTQISRKLSEERGTHLFLKQSPYGKIQSTPWVLVLTTMKIKHLPCSESFWCHSKLSCNVCVFHRHMISKFLWI